IFRNHGGFKDEIVRIVDFLHGAEKKLDIRIKTVAYEVSNVSKTHIKNGIFLLVSSSSWMISPPMVSLYSLLIRSGSAHTIGEDVEVSIKKMGDGAVKLPCSVDQAYYKKAEESIKRIFRLKRKM